MRVLFLDIDGVLNSASYRKSAPSTGDIDVDFRDLARRLPTLLDAWCVRRVQSICDDTGAVIVLSTSWRVLGLDVVRPILRDAGLTADVVDKIGREGGGRSRGMAIRAWVGYHRDVADGGAWVALDDRRDVYEDLGALHCVMTDDAHGITDDDARAAVLLLGGEVAR